MVTVRFTFPGGDPKAFNAELSAIPHDHSLVRFFPNGFGEDPEIELRIKRADLIANPGPDFDAIAICGAPNAWTSHQIAEHYQDGN